MQLQCDALTTTYNSSSKYLHPLLQSQSVFADSCVQTPQSLILKAFVHCTPLAVQMPPALSCFTHTLFLCTKQENTLRYPQVQALGAEVEDSKQRQHRTEQEHQFALAALQAQLKHAAGEMEVLRAGAGHTKDQALSAMKVGPLSLEGRSSLP